MDQAANWNPSQVPTTGDNLTFPSGATTSVNNNIPGSLQVGNLSITGAYTFTGNSFTIPATLLTYGGSGSNINLAGLTLNGIWEIQSSSPSNTNTITSVISGAGGFDLQSGTLILNGLNSYSGTTTLGTNATLRAGTTQAFGTGPSTSVTIGQGSVLDLNSFSNTIGSLSGLFGSSVNLGSGTLTLNNANIATGFYGTISGTGGLTLTGGNLNLLNTNTYTGTTTIENGSTLNALNLGSSSSLTFGPGPGKIEFGSHTSSTASIAFNGPATISTNTYDITLSGAITGTGQSLTKLGPGTLTLTGANSNAGPLTISGGTLNLNTASLGSISSILFLNFGSTLQAGSDLTITQPTTLSANGTFDTNGNDITISGPISGPNYLIKAGTGTLTLTAPPTSNTYAGNTIIQSGTLNAGSTNFPATSAKQLVFAGDGTGIFQLSSNFTSLTTVFASDIVLMGNGTIDTNGFDMTASGIVAGLPTYSFTKAGSGTLTLTGDNIYTGPTNVTGGTLQAGTPLVPTTKNFFGIDSAVTLSSGTTLDLNNHDADIGSLSGPVSSFVTLGSGVLNFKKGNGSTFSGVISGTGGVTNTSGTQTLAGANTYSGPTTINGGTLRAGSNSALGNGSSAVAINNGGTLSLQQTQNNISSLTMGATSTLQLSVLDSTDYGKLTATGTANITGTLIVTALPGFNASGFPITLLSSSGLSGTFTTTTFLGDFGSFHPQITYTPTEVLLGSMTPPPTGIFTWAGDTNSSADWNTANHWVGPPATPPSTGDSLVFPSPIVTSSTSTNDIGPLTLGTIAINAAYTIKSDSAGNNLSVTSFSGVAGSTLDMGPNTLTVTNANSGTSFSGAIAGLGGSLNLMKGTLNLLGTNTYSGTTTIQGGSTLNTLNLGSSTALTFGLDGGTIAFGSDTSSAATIILNDPAAISTNAFTVTLSGDILGNGSQLTKQGSGTLILTGTNSNAGPISIEEGILNLDSSSLGSTTAISFNAAGGTLQTNEHIAISQPVTLNANGTIDTNGFNLHLASGAISGSSLYSLIKAGDGTLSLSGSNTYSGPTYVTGGTLEARTNSTGSAGPFGVNSAVTLSSGTTLDLNGFNASIASLSGPGSVTLGGGTLTLNNGNDSIFSGVISGTGGGITLEAGTQTLAGANTYTGPTTLRGGSTLNTVSLGNSSALSFGMGGGTITFNNTAPINSGATINLFDAATITTNGPSVTFSGPISGLGSLLTKEGSGTLILAGTSNYSGATIVNNGTLQAGSNQAFGNNSDVTVNNSSTLSLQQTTNSISRLSLSPSSTLQVSVTSRSNHGQLNVATTANLGGTLLVNALSGFEMIPGQRATLLTSASLTPSAQFAKTLFQGFSDLIPVIIYTPTDVILSVEKTPSPHPSGSHTEVVFTGFHQQHQYITRKCSQLRSRLFASSANNAGSGDMGIASDNSESFTAETSGSNSATKATASLGGSSSLQQRIAAVQRPAAFSSGPAYTYCEEIADSQVYASSLYSTGSVETRDTQAGFNYDSVGGLVGFDRFFADQESGGWGAVAQYKRQNSRIDNNGGSTKVDQLHTNLYATYIPFCDCPYFSLNGVAGVAYAWDKLERNTGPNQSLRADARTHETLFDLLLQAEYLLSAENTSWIPCNAAISPWLGAGYIYDRIAGYQESGAGIYNLAVNAQTAQSLVSSVGARFLSLWDIGQTTLLAELDLGWQHQFSNGSRNVFFTAYEVNTSPATLSTVQAGRDTLLVGLDLTAAVGCGWEIEGTASYHLNNMYHDLTFYLGLNKRF